MKNILNNSKVLVTGGTGMIGRYLVDKLLEKGCQITVVSLDSPDGLPKQVKFMKLDLTVFDNCLKACEGQDYVFNLIGIKGSPKMSRERPASFMVPMLMFNTAMMEAAMRTNVNGVSIKEVAEAIRDCYDKSVEIDWDTTKPKGDARRLMDTTRAESYGFKCTTSLEDGIRETLNWFLDNRDIYKKRNNYFTKGAA
jgi:nucleoside-diphosphate-sugar epimerase